ncbi:hypothetical protein CAC42_6031 [Sphaceloma murrayae]|uniref:Epoxide hydrolase N-terminal domain-containing protein n=1 Tax=Sphaceloma murrayae TaxID=2082308 RepID=A0A2K1QV41_9PEZI|nr:hypothetical protein CAC42_6031 [Sphaceloma murrayae]
MGDYTKIPSAAKVKPTPFTVNVPEEKLQQMVQLIKLSPIGPSSYENQDTSREFGVSKDWLAKAKDHWATDFDWRAHEKRINSYPNYHVEVTDDDGISKWNMHFIALFSNNENAIPIGFFHGWPGSVLEFLDMLDLIKNKYTPDTLPYHIIVPSLPGYAFSSGPPLTKDANRIDMSRVCQKVMHALGFEKGYLAQGGDLGSFVSRQAAQDDDACKGFHLNMTNAPPPSDADKLPVEEIEKRGLEKGRKWIDSGTAYAQEHGTRTSTVGLVLSSSPIAMLAWIGEKFLEWSDEDPPLDRILESVSLYWLTDTFPRCIYPYRSLFGPNRLAMTKASEPKTPNTKPMGFSWFPGELIPSPISWIAKTGNLVHYNRHSSGGHFAAMEKPAELFADVEEWVKIAWK